VVVSRYKLSNSDFSNDSGSWRKRTLLATRSMLAQCMLLLHATAAAACRLGPMCQKPPWGSDGDGDGDGAALGWRVKNRN